jgi:hypothetical protein
MNNTNNKSRASKSLYVMVARAQHDERSGYEGAVYMLLILSGVFAILQAAQQAL